MSQPLRIRLVGVPQLDRKLEEAARRVLPRAAARSLNTTATTVRKEDVRAIATRMGLKQKDVRDRSKIHRAKPSRLEAQVEYSGKGMNLIRFKARQTKKGVTASPWGKRRLFPHAFIATVRGSFDSGNTLVMVRRKIGGQRVGRLPIRPVRGPGVAKTAADPELDKQRRATIARVLPDRLRSDLAFYMARLLQR